MTFLKAAERLTQMGFHVFPLRENGKKPIYKGAYINYSVSSPGECVQFWQEKRTYNIGIATEKFGDEGDALLVVDIDDKEGKKGSQTVMALELKGQTFPKTLTQITPTGGKHLIYKVKSAIPQTQGLFGADSGIDTRSRGGLIVGAGSKIDGKSYYFENVKTPIEWAPKWLLDACAVGIERERKTLIDAKDVSQEGAMNRAIAYLQEQAPIAVEGAGGDHATFIVANKLKDLGVSKDNCLNLMADYWNDNCEPPWGMDELHKKIINAYTYGQNKIGVDAPESEFETLEDTDDEPSDPVSQINKEFAFAVIGGKSTIIHQIANELNYMSVQAFHDYLKPWTVQTGNGKRAQVSKIWFESKRRPTYRKVEMVPKDNAPKDIYNLWRGFSCTPLAETEEATAEMVEGVAMFKEHLLENICKGKEDLYQWLMGFFAHLVQKPWEKPLVAIVFMGKRGTGKNAILDRVGNLVDQHYKVVAHRRYLTGQFNSHFENCIFSVLDEVAWAGDKEAEGVLKDLITGTHHSIEYKGKEPYKVKNLLRVGIVSNEDWCVPAGHEERRFAIFEVGEGRMQDNAFFAKMEELIDKKGGQRLLLKELQEFDLSKVNVNKAPQTVGLFKQKIESLNLVHAWWYSCLKEGELLGEEFNNKEWPVEILKSAMREAFLADSKKRGVRTWLASDTKFGEQLSQVCPELKPQRVRRDGIRTYCYKVPPLSECRNAFSRFINFDIEWEEIEGASNVVDATGFFG